MYLNFHHLLFLRKILEVCSEYLLRVLDESVNFQHMLMVSEQLLMSKKQFSTGSMQMLLQMDLQKQWLMMIVEYSVLWNQSQLAHFVLMIL